MYLVENYIIKPLLIQRVIQKENNESDVAIEGIDEIINTFVDDMKQNIIDDYATEISNKDKSLAIKTVNERARNIVNPIWAKNKLDIVPGKKLISLLSKWSQDKYNVSFNSFKLARMLLKNEIDVEIKNLLTLIENNKELSYD